MLLNLKLMPRQPVWLHQAKHNKFFIYQYVNRKNNIELGYYLRNFNLGKENTYKLKYPH